jgi:glutathione S-transferase
MAIKLYGSPLSTCTKRVATILYLKQIPHEFFPIDLSKGEQKAPEFVEKQPFGQVPYLDDDGFVVYESRAICRYLEEKYSVEGEGKGPTLVPTKDVKAKALFEQAASVEMANFDPYAGKAAYESVIKKYVTSYVPHFS